MCVVHYLEHYQYSLKGGDLYSLLLQKVFWGKWMKSAEHAMKERLLKELVPLHEFSTQMLNDYQGSWEERPTVGKSWIR